MELRCLVADDEPIARQILETYIGQVPYLTLVGACKNAFEVMEVLQRETVDVLFLDINMPQLSGMSLLRTLQQRPAVIITTAYPEHAVESFALSVTDYLLKPFSIERFLQALAKVQAQKAAVAPPAPAAPVASTPATSGPDHLFVKVDKKITRVNLADLQYIEAYGNYIKLHVGNEVLLVAQTLSGFQERLPAEQFVQVHKSYVVNVAHIQSLEGNQLTLGTHEVPVGKSHATALRARLGGE